MNEAAALRRRHGLRVLSWTAGSVLALILLLPAVLAAGLLLLADTEPGRAWLARQIAQATAGSGTHVRIGAIEPGLPGSISVRDVTVADEAGVWLSIEQARLDWNPWRLTEAVLRIDSLRGQGIALARLPEEEAPTQPATPFDPDRLLPDLPVGISVGEVDLRDVALGEPVVGVAARLEAQARVTLTPGSGADLALDIQRTDGTTGRLSVQAQVVRAADGDRLGLQAELYEPPGGLVAAMAGWPEAAPVTLTLTGQGPLDALQGRIAATVGDLAALQGGYRARYAADGDVLGLALELEGEVGGLLPPELQPLAGGPISLAVDATATGGGAALRLDSLALSTPAAALTGEASLDLAAGTVDANLAVDRLDAAAVQGFVPGLELAQPHLALHVEGSFERPEIALRLQADRLALPEAGLRGVALQVQARPVAPLTDGPLPAFEISLDGTADGVRLADMAEVEELLQPGLSLSLSGILDPEAEVLELAEARVELESLTLQAQGRIAAEGPLRLQAVVDAAELAPLAAALDLPLRGSDLHAELELSGSDLLAAEPGAWDAKLDARLGEPGYGDTPLEPLLGQELTLSAQASGTGTSTVSISRLEAQGQNLTLTGDGVLELAQDGVAADLRLDFPDLAALSELAGVEMTGEAVADVAVSGSLSAPKLEVDVKLAEAVVAGNAMRQVEVTARIDPFSDQLKVTLDGRGEAMNLPLQLRADLVLDADGAALTVSGVEADIAGTGVTGDLRLAPATGLAEGVLRIASADLAPLASRFGLALEGAADGTVTLSARPGGQGVIADLEVTGLEEAGSGLSAAAARLQADLVMAPGGPRGALDLALEEVEIGAVEFETLGLRGEGDLGTGMQVSLRGEGKVQVAGEPQPLTVSAQAVVEGQPPDLTVALSDLRLAVAEKVLQQQGTATIAMEGDTTAVRDLRLAIEGGGLLSAEVDVRPAAIEAKLRAEGVPLALAGVFVEEVPVSGSLEMSADLLLRPGSPQGELSLTLSEVRSTREDLAGLPASELTAEARLSEGRLRLEAQWQALGGDPGRFSMSMPLATPPGQLVPEPDPHAPLDGSLAWSGSLDQIELFLPGVDSDVSGRFEAAMTITGTLDQPRVPGRVTISEGSYRNYTTGTIVNDIELRIDGGEDSQLEIAGRATDGEAGRLTAEGRLDLGADPLPTFTVDIDASSFVAARLDLATGTISADLTASGTPLRNRVEGSVVVDALAVQVDGGLPPSAAVIPVTVYPRPGALPLNPPEEEEEEAQPSRTRLDISITIPPRMTVAGRGLDSTWSGRLQVAGSTANPLVTGQITAVRGNFTIVGKRFALSEGTISFDGSRPPNPNLNIVFTYSGEQATANVVISGTAANPQLNLTSNPPMPEGDIISAVLFNRRSTQLSAAEALEVASSLAALTGRGNPGAGITSTVRQTLGLDVLNVGSDASGAPTLDAGRYITDNVYVGVRQGLGADTSSVAVEVDLTDNIQIETDVGVNSKSSVGVNWKFDY